MQSQYRTYSQQGAQRSPHTAVPRRGIGPMVAGAHPQSSMTPVQIQAQQESQRQASELAKRRSRKPTDKNIPDGVENTIIGDGVQRYRELRDVERKLDATMMRKRLDIQDASSRTVKRYKTLRVFISNTVEDQPWQGDALDVDAFDFSANNDASYRIKIEGRLLDNDSDDQEESDEENGRNLQGKDDDTKDSSFSRSKTAQRYRFSHFFKSMNVEFERNKTKDGIEQAVEWKKPAVPPNAVNPPNAADFDQLEFKRGGDENLNITIHLVRDESQERFQLSPALTEILDANEATKAEVVTGIWDYIQMMSLQEDDEKRSFRCDERLKIIFQRDTGYIPYIPDAIGPHMTSLPTIKIPYTIRVDQEFHKNPLPTIYDVRVSVDDPLRAKLQAFMTNTSYASMLREITTLNDQLATLVQALAHAKAKNMFFDSLSKDPANFLKKWISSQKRDLEVMTGEATRGGAEEASGEEWRRGGANGVWSTENVRESVNLMLSSRSRQ